MSAIVLQAQRGEGAPWATVNRFVGENMTVASMSDREQPAARSRLLLHAAECADRYEREMLPGRKFRVIELDHVHARAPSV